MGIRGRGGLTAVVLAALGIGSQLGDGYRQREYATAETSDRVSRLGDQLAEGVSKLEHEPSRGFLPSLLETLEIPTESQLLVFSKTSFQTGLITAKTPRAIYFNDDTYIAWEQSSRSLEIVAFDPNLGPLFYTLSQDPAKPVAFERQSSLCLRCHDSASLSGNGYPRLLIGSGVTDDEGHLVSHEGWEITTQSTPLSKRWGGWYITGRHGSQLHRGNQIARLVDEGTRWEISDGANRESLEGLVDMRPYLSEHSDIVAALVAEHQIETQNSMTRLRWFRDDEGADELVRSMTFKGEAALSETITGTSAFAETFQKRGPRDATSRSLRELDLKARVFKYPLSYLVYSDAFRTLPSPWKQTVVRKLRDELDQRGPLGQQALDIWQATDPESR